MGPLRIQQSPSLFLVVGLCGLLYTQDLHREVEKNKAGIEATRAEVATKRREGETVGLTLSSEAQQLIKSIEEMTAKSAVVRAHICAGHTFVFTLTPPPFPGILYVDAALYCCRTCIICALPTCRACTAGHHSGPNRRSAAGPAAGVGQGGHRRAQLVHEEQAGHAGDAEGVVALAPSHLVCFYCRFLLS